MTFPATLTGGGEPERLQASVVSGNYFQTFGVAPVLGRGFTLENEKPGQDQVTVLSHAIWQSRFAGDPSIVNKTIVLNGKACEVIGVMPRGGSARGGAAGMPVLTARAAEPGGGRPSALARRAGMRQQHVSRFETGRFAPTTTVSQEVLPSVNSVRTRVIASVPCAASRIRTLKSINSTLSISG